MTEESKEDRRRRQDRERQRNYYQATKGDRVAPVAGTVRVMITLRISPESADYLEAQGNKAGYMARLLEADIAKSRTVVLGENGLLPCPFCGGVDIGSEYWDSPECDSWRVYCKNWECSGEVNDSQCDQVTAERMWNARARAKQNPSQ